MKEPKNEAALCAGAIGFLSERRGEELKAIAQPGVADRQNEAVELVAESPSARFVFEHTRIESFPNQIADGKAFSELMEPLESTMNGVLPPGTYEVIIPPGVASRVRRKDVASVRGVIQDWVVAEAPKLSLGSDDDDDRPWSLTAAISGVPFEVTLQRTPPDDRVVVFVARFSPPNLEGGRSTRVDTALERKCPKLAEAKRAFGAVSVLILESDDVALANRHVASATIVEAIASRRDVPDIILLVETDRGLAWKLWIVKDGNLIYPDIKEPGPYDVPLPRGRAAESD